MMDAETAGAPSVCDHVPADSWPLDYYQPWWRREGEVQGRALLEAIERALLCVTFHSDELETAVTVVPEAGVSSV